MRAIITKVHPPKTNPKGVTFIRVEFELEDGKWAKTDVCPSYRNYRYWKPVLDRGVGTKIINVELRKDQEVDADSPVTTIV